MIGSFFWFFFWWHGFFWGACFFFRGFTWFSIFKVCFFVFSSQEVTKALKEDLDHVRRGMDTLILQAEDYDRYDLLTSPFFFIITLNLTPTLHAVPQACFQYICLFSCVVYFMPRNVLTKSTFRGIKDTTQKNRQIY